MTTPALFLLLNQWRNAHIALGDSILIDDAYGKAQFQIGYIRSCRINGNRLKHLLPTMYTRNLQRISPFRAKIIGLKQEGEDLVIRIEAA